MSKILYRGLNLILSLACAGCFLASSASAETEPSPAKSSNSSKKTIAYPIQDLIGNYIQVDTLDVPENNEAPPPEQYGSLEPDLETLNVRSEEGVVPEESLNIDKDDSYYDSEDEEESSDSIISFNFLYYLLQKFKFSNSLQY